MLFKRSKRYIIMSVFFILINSFLSSKQIKINYRVEQGVLNLTEELMLSTPVSYKNYEMYVVFERGELTYSNAAHSEKGLFQAVELYPVAVIRVKKDNPHDGHDSYTLKMIDEPADMDTFSAVMDMAQKLCREGNLPTVKSLDLSMSEIMMILQILEII